MNWEPLQPVLSRPFTLGDARELAAGRRLSLGELTDLTAVDDENSALGRRVFTVLPLREDPYLTWLAARPEVWSSVGLRPADDGTVPGMVVFPSSQGDGARVGIACVFCHGGDGVLG